MFAHRRFGTGTMVVAGAMLAVVAAAGCDGGGPAPECPVDDEIAGACAGVPPLPEGGEAECATTGPCADAVEVDSDAALLTAVSGASSGACIRLKAGTYGAVTLPGGVSLSGESVEAVKIDGVVLGAGKGAVLCGLTVGADGVKIEGATQAKIDSVHVSGSEGVGIDVAPGSSVDVLSSEIDQAGTYGVAALDADDSTSVSLDRTIISESVGGGVWMACKAACGCGAMLDVSRSILRKNRIVGAAIAGATVSIENVDILDGAPGTTYFDGQYGGGLSIAACASAFAKGLRVRDNISFGVLVDESAATLGGEGPDEGIDVSGNVIGLWIQNAKGAHGGHVNNATFDGNHGVGIGVSGDSHGWIFCKTKISGTYLEGLPVDATGAKKVGDGFDWLDGSEVALEDVTLSGNARASIVIDGSADGSLTNVTLTGGDEQKGIVQQQFPMGGSQPMETMSPSITTDPGEVYAVPLPPAFAAQP